MAQPSMQQVRTMWEDTEEDKSLLRAYLPHDVVELSLQVKTTQGMHQIRRDAWGGHSLSFKKWGSQIQPTSSTRNKISNFRKQWTFCQGEVTRRANAGASTQSRPVSSTSRRRGPGQFRVNPNTRQMPQFLGRVLSGQISTMPYREPPIEEHTPSPVAEPLSQMALLAAGMLPLGRQSRQGTPIPTLRGPAPTREGTPMPSVEGPTPIVITPTSSRSSSTYALHTSPISSDDEIPPLTSVRVTHIKLEPEEEAISAPERPSMDNATPDEEVPEEEEGQQNHPTGDRPADAQTTQEDQPPPPASDAALSPSPSTSGMPKISKVGSIPLAVFQGIDSDEVPDLEQITVSGEGLDVLPERMEEDMDTSPPQGLSTSMRFTLKTPEPPVEPEVKVEERVQDSTSEEETEEVPPKLGPKRKMRKKKSEFLIRIRKMPIGPNNLDVYRVTDNSATPPTPMTPPANLFPGNEKALPDA